MQLKLDFFATSIIHTVYSYMDGYIEQLLLQNPRLLPIYKYVRHVYRIWYHEGTLYYAGNYYATREKPIHFFQLLECTRGKSCDLTRKTKGLTSVDVCQL